MTTRTLEATETSTTNRRLLARMAVAALALLLAAPAARAIVRPTSDSAAVRAREVQHPDLVISNLYRPVAELPAGLGIALRGDLAALGVAEEAAYFDLRTGRWGTLMPNVPLIPGSGRGNTLSWADLGAAAPATPATPASNRELGERALGALLGYLAQHDGALGLADAADGRPTVTVHDGGALVQIHVKRSAAGIPVRDSFVNAVVNHGNLVLLGARNWGALPAAAPPALGATAAESAVAAHLGRQPDGYRAQPELALVPMESGADETQVVPGLGLAYRLVWVVRPSFAGAGDGGGTWEALVDAGDGEVLAFRDTNQYAAVRSIEGGVYPLTNDGNGVEGTEQPGYPMPFADVDAPADGEARVTDTGGGVACVEGPIRTTLAGPYVAINDNCGAIDETAAAGDLDLEAGPGTNCVVPAGHSAGDTHAARSGFYEINRQQEVARGQLAQNAWVRSQLTANMNIDDTCNANWNGTAINFFKRGFLTDATGAPTTTECSNTGEIGAVFDHEWGHGMDANDANPGISSPGEAIADIYGQLRLPDSCFGRGFLLTRNNCNGGYGDPCFACSGVRGSDWAEHQSGRPHDIAWILSPNDDPPVIDTIQGGCVGVVGIGVPQTGPCGQETHCEGTIAAEAGWDLVHRDLQGYAGGAVQLDRDSALHLGQRLTFLGGGLIGDWYQCAVPDPDNPQLGSGNGCNADGGYLNYLAADDDNGDLSDGTPHMTAIFAALDRHGIACQQPSPADSGCAGGPTQAPGVTVSPLNRGARLLWSPVPGAAKYRIVRTEGALGCFLGKAEIATTSATEFVDSGLKNGFPYHYGVIAVGANDSCFSSMSDCEAALAVPAAGADLAIAAGSEAVALSTGDGDAVIDNCESGRLTFQVDNTGDVPLTNVRIVSAEAVGRPEFITTVSQPQVAASLGSCGGATGSVDFVAGGLAPGDTVELAVEVTADQIAPRTVRRVFAFTPAETDFLPVASRTYTFDDPLSLDGWENASGEYLFQPGSTSPSPLGHRRSTGQTEQCDQLRSPALRLTAASTLSLWTQFNTEPANGGINDPTQDPIYYDRGNVGLVAAGGGRTRIDPDGGRAYNAAGGNGFCVTAGEPGWATDPLGDTGADWRESNFSAATLAATGLAGTSVRIDVAYGVDQLVTGEGFHLDHVTVTDFEEPAADAQTDVCPPPPPPIDRVHGSGWLRTIGGSDTDADDDSDSDSDSDSDKVGFSFDAKRDLGGFTGKLKVTDKRAGVKIDAKDILSLSAGTGACNGVATGSGAFAFTASGKFNGTDGATFRACGEDRGDPGKGNDTLYVECLAGCSYDTGSRTPDDVIDGGNIHLHSAAGGDALRASASPAGEDAATAAEPKVLELDPVLLTAAPAGTPLVLTALVHGEDGLVLGGRAVTLSWRTRAGATGSAAALTNALGVAVFTAPVAAGETFFTATAPGLESNGVAVTGTSLGLP